MSTHYRTTIGLVFPDASEIADNQKDFPIPARPQGQSDSNYYRQVQSIIQDLDDELNEVNDYIAQLSDASDKWMALRTSMTGNERLSDNTAYDEFIATTPFPRVNLPRIRGGDLFCSDLRSLLDQIECICVQMNQLNQSYDTTSFQMEIEQRLPRFVLEEIFKAKDEEANWSTDQLKDRLRNILRRREQIDSLELSA
ncbi:hypothetical protein niasHT_017753 [Heterodera trifolii]|uniref:Uncharacterized protein n=1 Tax=Heterodera trifolii TaxID=157864 RepID=A0ABD2LJG1_9BILA